VQEALVGTKEALVGMSDEAWAAAAAKRSKGLVHLLGIEEAEAGDTSIKGRLSIIAKLKAAKRAEIGRGQTGSWLYDVNRHLSICASLRKEYEALEEILDSGKPAASQRNRADNVIELRP
jgi:hypothetical protein